MNARIGIPYAHVCAVCYRGVVCPACGEHLADKRGAYQKHWDAEHEDVVDIRNIDGTLVVVDAEEQVLHDAYEHAKDGCSWR